MSTHAPLYDDGRVACDDDAITLRWYYPWGSRRIPYRSIRSVKTVALSPVRGKWRLWGSGDLVHWYNLDARRPGKTTAIEIDLGRHILPMVTPDDPDAVGRILADHVAR